VGETPGRRPRSIRFGFALLATGLTLLAGCATLRSVEVVPISAPSAIAGTWTGTVTPGRWGVSDPIVVTITPDGQLTAEWDSNTAWGSVTVRDGQATYHMEPTVYEGTIRLYRSGGTQSLVLDDEVQPFTAEVRPRP
jgi:hypothetical protein